MPLSNGTGLTGRAEKAKDRRGVDVRVSVGIDVESKGILLTVYCAKKGDMILGAASYRCLRTTGDDIDIAHVTTHGTKEGQVGFGATSSDGRESGDGGDGSDNRQCSWGCSDGGSYISS